MKKSFIQKPLALALFYDHLVQSFDNTIWSQNQSIQYESDTMRVYFVKVITKIMRNSVLEFDVHINVGYFLERLVYQAYIPYQIDT